MVLTPRIDTARRIGLLWGTYAVHTRDVDSFEDMVAKAKRMALRHKIAKAGDRVILIAGVPFKTPGSTNVLHVVRIIGDELKGYS
jgi:pyruvate kinase